MWTGSRPRRAARACAGYTFVEMMIAVVIVLIGALIVTTAMSTANRTEKYLDTVRRVTERGQKVIHEVAGIVESSRKILQDDAVGRSYLAALDLSRVPLAKGARLPYLDAGMPLGPDDPGEPRTGNVILLVRESDPLPCVADAMSGKILYVDTYRLVCIYPTESDRYVVPGTDPALDLAYWWSVPYASKSQIDDIDDATQRRNVVRDLFTRHGVPAAWDIDEALVSAFYRLDAAGTVDGAPSQTFSLAEAPGLSDASRLVLSNLQLARTNDASRVRRAVLTERAGATSWVPDGFEVQMAGAGALRQMWLNLVVETVSPGTRATVVERFTLIVAARSF